MQIVKPESIYINKEGKTPYQIVEMIGRACYHSEDKIAEGSDIPFVTGLIKRQHWAMLEHSNIILNMCNGLYYEIKDTLDTSFLHCTDDGIHCVMSGSFRAWRDMFAKGYYDVRDKCQHRVDISFVLYGLYQKYPLVFEEVAKSIYEDDTLLDPDMDNLHHFNFTDEATVADYFREHPEMAMQHITHTVKFITDRGVTHELVRHRPCAFAQESTRYVNYSKHGIAFIKPCFFKEIDEKSRSQYEKDSKWDRWVNVCSYAEMNYDSLIKMGAKPQEARDVLPTSVRTVIYMTTTESEWQHILNLRYHGTTGAPHPQMKEIMELIYSDLCEKSGGRIK